MTFTDQIGRQIALPGFPPRRIVSLVPSQTELLANLGLNEQVVGVTKFCVHPTHWRKEKEIIGGTKNINLERIKALKPDLIIANQEENDREQVEALAADYPVWVSRVVDFPSALEMIKSVGQLTQTTGLALKLTENIIAAFTSVETFAPRKAAYLIWRKPYMVSGGDTFIHAMMKLAGFENVFGQQNRYPEVTVTELNAAQPDVLLLSSEPYPFKEKHLAELTELCPQTVIKLVDGELFSWYGSRLLHSAAYFRNLQRMFDK